MGDLLDQLLLLAEEDLAVEEKSVIHSGDTDSSDDDDNRDFENQKYNDSGKAIKHMLNSNHHDKATRHYDSSATTSTSTSWRSRTSLQTGAKSQLQPAATSRLQPAATLRLQPAAKSQLQPTANSSNSQTFSKDIYTDPYFGIRIINPLISSQLLKERMEGKEVIPICRAKAFMQRLTPSQDWVTAGVVASKTTRTSQKGTQYAIWVLSDLLGEIKTVSLFLFGSAFKDLWKCSVGTVIGVLNPTVMENNSKSDEATLNVNNGQKVMIFGQSKDFGTCKSMKKNGEKCTSIVNTNRCEYCIYHVKQEYNKCSTRSDLQANYSGGGLSALRNKVLGKNEVFYGGHRYTAVPAKRSKKLAEKDDNLMKLLSGVVAPSKKITKPKARRAVNVELSAKQRSKDLLLLQKLGGSSEFDLGRKTDFNAIQSAEVSLTESKSTALNVIAKLKHSSVDLQSKKSVLAKKFGATNTVTTDFALKKSVDPDILAKRSSALKALSDTSAPKLLHESIQSKKRAAFLAEEDEYDRELMSNEFGEARKNDRNGKRKRQESRKQNDEEKGEMVHHKASNDVDCPRNKKNKIGSSTKDELERSSNTKIATTLKTSVNKEQTTQRKEPTSTKDEINAFSNDEKVESSSNAKLNALSKAVTIEESKTTALSIINRLKANKLNKNDDDSFSNDTDCNLSLDEGQIKQRATKTLQDNEINVLTCVKVPQDNALQKDGLKMERNVFQGNSCVPTKTFQGENMGQKNNQNVSEEMDDPFDDFIDFMDDAMSEIELPSENKVMTSISVKDASKTAKNNNFEATASNSVIDAGKNLEYCAKEAKNNNVETTTSNTVKDLAKNVDNASNSAIETSVTTKNDNFEATATNSVKDVEDSVNGARKASENSSNSYNFNVTTSNYAKDGVENTTMKDAATDALTTNESTENVNSLSQNIGNVKNVAYSTSDAEKQESLQQNPFLEDSFSSCIRQNDALSTNERQKDAFTSEESEKDIFVNNEERKVAFLNTGKQKDAFVNDEMQKDAFAKDEFQEVAFLSEKSQKDAFASHVRQKDAFASDAEGQKDAFASEEGLKDAFESQEKQKDAFACEKRQKDAFSSEDERQKDAFASDEGQKDAFASHEGQKGAFVNEKRQKEAFSSDSEKQKDAFLSEKGQKHDFSSNDEGQKNAFASEERQKDAFESQERQKDAFACEKKQKDAFPSDDERQKDAFESHEVQKDAVASHEGQKDAFATHERQKDAFLSEKRQKDAFSSDDERQKDAFASHERQKDAFVSDKKQKDAFASDERQKDAILKSQTHRHVYLRNETQKDALKRGETHKVALRRNETQKVALKRNEAQKAAILSNASLKDAFLNNATQKDPILNNATQKDAILNNATQKDAVLNNATPKDAFLNNATQKDAFLNNVTEKDASSIDQKQKDAAILNNILRDATLLSDSGKESLRNLLGKVTSSLNVDSLFNSIAKSSSETSEILLQKTEASEDQLLQKTSAETSKSSSETSKSFLESEKSSETSKNLTCHKSETPESFLLQKSSSEGRKNSIPQKSFKTSLDSLALQKYPAETLEKSSFVQNASSESFSSLRETTVDTALEYSSLANVAMKESFDLEKETFLSKLMTPENSFLPKVMTPDNSSLCKVMTPDNSSLPKVMTPDNSSLPKMMTPDDSSLPKMMTPDNSSLPKVMTPDHSSLPKVMTPDDSSLPKMMTPGKLSLRKVKTPEISSSKDKVTMLESISFKKIVLSETPSSEKITRVESFLTVKPKRSTSATRRTTPKTSKKITTPKTSHSKISPKFDLKEHLEKSEKADKAAKREAKAREKLVTKIGGSFAESVDDKVVTLLNKVTKEMKKKETFDAVELSGDANDKLDALINVLKDDKTIVGGSKALKKFGERSPFACSTSAVEEIKSDEGRAKHEIGRKRINQAEEGAIELNDISYGFKDRKRIRQVLENEEQSRKDVKETSYGFNDRRRISRAIENDEKNCRDDRKGVEKTTTEENCKETSYKLNDKQRTSRMGENDKKESVEEITYGFKERKRISRVQKESTTKLSSTSPKTASSTKTWNIVTAQEKAVELEKLEKKEAKAREKLITKIGSSFAQSTDNKALVLLNKDSPSSIKRKRDEPNIELSGEISNKLDALIEANKNVPKLGFGLNPSNLIDLNSPLQGRKMNRAKEAAIKWVQSNGPIKKSDPNSTKSNKKRNLPSFDNEPDPKKPKDNDFYSDRFKKMMAVTSRHQDLLDQRDEEEREKYFEKLERKEQMEEKMMTTYKVDCKAVSCLVCKYTSFSATDLCKEQRHPLTVFDAIKRFFKCGHCGQRTASLKIVPLHGCNHCGSQKWERTTMMAEKKVTAMHSLSIRGGEQKYMGSVATDANINLMIPDDE